MSKKTTQLSELVTGDAAVWIEVVDLNEVDPTLQNKKMKYTNVTPLNDHVQNTDTYLDFGGSFQISAATLVGMDAIAHQANSDTFLDELGANPVSAVNAADAVTKKHTQQTDYYLDFGGSDQVAADELADLVAAAARPLNFGWVVGTPSSTAEMELTVDSGGLRWWRFNPLAQDGILTSDALYSLAVGRYVSLTFPSGHI